MWTESQDNTVKAYVWKKPNHNKYKCQNKLFNSIQVDIVTAYYKSIHTLYLFQAYLEFKMKINNKAIQ